MKRNIILISLITFFLSAYAEDFSVLNGAWKNQFFYDDMVDNPQSSVGYGGSNASNIRNAIEINIDDTGAGWFRDDYRSFGIAKVEKQGNNKFLLYLLERLRADAGDYKEGDIVPGGEYLITVIDEDTIFFDDGGLAFEGPIYDKPWHRISGPAKIRKQAGVMNDTRVRLRTKPNLESDTWAFLNTGDEVTIIDKSAEMQKIGDMEDYWYKVQTELFPDGWVYGAFIDIEKDYEIVWIDTEFENKVRGILFKYRDPIMKSDLDRIPSLTIMGESIVRIDDIAHFSNLTSVVLSNHDITDISPLSVLTKLTYLGLSHNYITDISALSNLTNLTELRLLTGKKISDLRPLSGLTSLTALMLHRTSVSDINPLSDLTNLTNLWLTECQISDVSALSDLTNLAVLNLADNQISDIHALSSLTNLDIVNLEKNQISDISALSDLINLTHLGLSGNDINNISALSGLVNLAGLDLNNNDISDVNALFDLINLTALSLAYNDISDISPLSNLTNLTTLTLNNNDINDVRALSELFNLRTLALENTIDVSSLSGITNLKISPYLFSSQL